MPFGEVKEAFTWLLQLYFMLGGCEWHEHNLRVHGRLKRKISQLGKGFLTERELGDLAFLEKQEKSRGAGE